MKKISAFFVFLYMLSTSTLVFSQQKDKKNIIMVFIDDIGVEAVGCYGADDIKTPTMDKLANEGMKFENAHASPICTPSRVKLMTGKYNSRNYKKFGLLPASETTFANTLKKEGYATAIAGKWQLSYGESDPLNKPYYFGFDEYCLWNLVEKGLPRFKNPVLHKNGEALDGEGKYGPNVVNDFALDFIEKNQDNPFLLYYPMIQTHDPFQPTPDMEEEYAALEDLTLNDPAYFGANVEYMDKMLGRLVNKLDDLGIRENTVILIMGDNGTSSKVYTSQNNKQVKGGKGKSLTTGTHVPFIANCPSLVKKDVNVNLIDLTDFYPTMLDIVGIDRPEGLDGISFYPQLIGKKSNESRDFVFISYFGKKTYPVKQFAFNTEWKYYDNGAFYNTKLDPEEKNNLADSITVLSEDEQAQYRHLRAKVAEFKRVGDFPPKKSGKKKGKKGKGGKKKKAQAK
ncbi:sulfatase-like hydrolase/transferase [Sediminitomix flava]|uniref:Arylsulfatase A-like enzyme n=1 Tax=Sediminitomix flava TaxID=379075 RepID=A0A315Z964_SEDFL|nr:sulfatase-like hydrolase/transferase [Sediminitomix flava]PWJ41930.1 arylsulfatase A-like enzyme [Sediminitomix flava]